MFGLSLRFPYVVNALPQELLAISHLSRHIREINCLQCLREVTLQLNSSTLDNLLDVLV